MSGPIVFVAADPRECEPWVAKWSAVEKIASPAHWSRRGVFQGRTMVAHANGAGIERACAAAKMIPDPAALWNIGFGGAAAPELGIGEVIAAETVCFNGANFVCAQPRSARPFRTAKVQTIPCVAQTATEKRIYYAQGASVIEMEAAGIARAACEMHTPFYCVRAISDLAHEDFVNNFNAALCPDGRFSRTRLVAGALRNPLQGFGELLRLRSRAKIAANNLGDFLANCKF